MAEKCTTAWDDLRCVEVEFRTMTKGTFCGRRGPWCAGPFNLWWCLVSGDADFGDSLNVHCALTGPAKNGTFDTEKRLPSTPSARVDDLNKLSLLNHRKKGTFCLTVVDSERTTSSLRLRRTQKKLWKGFLQLLEVVDFVAIERAKAMRKCATRRESFFESVHFH